MSVVLLAERRIGGIVRPAVAKVLVAAGGRREAERLVALRDQARALGALGHRNVVAFDDLALIDGRAALVGPWVDGVDLVEWVEILRERDVTAPGRVVCDIVRAAAAALEAARNRPLPASTRALGVEHRDLKPTNLMVSRDGDLKVLDFATGFTSLAGRGARAGALQKGLVRYLSPDRRAGKRGGPPSDVYALGIVALELFRGRWLKRLHGHNPAHDRHLAEVVARLGDLGMRTPADEQALRNILLRMVAHDPEARPEAAEVLYTFRTLSDRAHGPSIEAFTHAHVVPYAAAAPRPAEPRAFAIVSSVQDLEVWVKQAPPRPTIAVTEIEDDDDEDDLEITVPTPLHARHRDFGPSQPDVTAELTPTQPASVPLAPIRAVPRSSPWRLLVLGALLGGALVSMVVGALALWWFGAG